MLDMRGGVLGQVRIRLAPPMLELRGMCFCKDKVSTLLAGADFKFSNESE